MGNEAKNKIVRQTSQRKVILEELCKVTSHPTAAEVYTMVRKRLPRVSLGTVYRNLELLNECGTIQKLDFGEPHKRFDGNSEPHYHINCVECGRVDDVHMPMDKQLEDKAIGSTGYRITGHHVSFSGVCPKCMRASANG
ncbi:MAG: transcriptional repressor [Proteobacteria bacterium]|nr:transcriptional repressor [Pseudomonadota bacterium]MBU1736724.1 transcriptional repressor [Pseudomonadota bacterium]